METDLGLKSHPEDREAGNRSCDPWIDSPACYPLHNHHSCAKVGRIDMWAGRHSNE